MNALLNAVDTTPVTTNVLLKDTTKVANVAVGTTVALTNMEANRINWEQGAYRTSNQALYAVLGDCLAFCGDMTLPEAKQRSASLESFYKDRGYTYKKDLPLATRVVRAVFGSRDRRRISTYSLVIRQAMKEKVLIADFSKWVEEHGGVQEISLGKSATYIKPADKAEIAKNNLKGKTPIGYAKSELLSHVADAQYLGDMCVLLAEQQADGSFGVYAVLRQDGLVNSAFTSLYALGKELEAKAKAEIKAANDVDGAVAKSA
jgi:hypothetical protein